MPFSVANRSPEQFWPRVAVGKPNECWEWLGPRHKRGYGRLNWMGKANKAHRVAMSLTDGDWNSPLHVLHHCDNPPCCNPAHLWRGTNRENYDDMASKGRRAILRGEEHGMAKLTADQVRYIRTSPKFGSELARELGVSDTLIYHIIKRRKWKHVP
jgi:hypothetical protein